MLLYMVGLAYKKLVKQRGVYLFAALDNIKWTDCGVSKTAGENTSAHTLDIITKIVNVTHFYAFLVQNFICF